MAILKIRDGRPGLSITDYNDLILELNRVQPTAIAQLRKDYKEIGKPVQKAVKGAIPANPPTSGIHKKFPDKPATGFFPRTLPGRETWSSNDLNKHTPVKSAKLEIPGSARLNKRLRESKKGVASIARLKISNPGVVIADMAEKPTSKPFSRKYKKTQNGRVIETRHRLNGQGRAMISALGGKPSRFVWPAAEKAVPATFGKSEMALQKAYDVINRRMAS